MSSRTRRCGGPIQSPDLLVLRGSPAAALQLPEPGDGWLRREQHEDLQRQHKKYWNHDLIYRGEIAENGGEGGSRAYYWRTRPAAYEYAQAIDEPPGPCNHGGVSNLRGEDAYSCRRDYCDVRFGRKIAKARWNGGNDE